MRHFLFFREILIGKFFLVIFVLFSQKQFISATCVYLFEINYIDIVYN